MGYFFSSATIMIQTKNNQRFIIKTQWDFTSLFFISHFYANIASFFLIFFSSFNDIQIWAMIWSCNMYKKQTNVML